MTERVPEPRKPINAHAIIATATARGWLTTVSSNDVAEAVRLAAVLDGVMATHRQITTLAWAVARTKQARTIADLIELARRAEANR